MFFGISCFIGVSAMLFMWRTPKEMVQHSSEEISNVAENIPLFFEPNTGQAAQEILFLTRGNGYQILFAQHEVTFVIKGVSSTMSFVNANSNVRVEGQRPFPGKSHYLLGSDSKAWKTDIPHFGKISYENIYPHIDLVFYEKNRQLEYDFIVRPNGNPNDIQLNFPTAKVVKISQENLILKSGKHQLLHHKPALSQNISGEKMVIAGNYTKLGEKRIGFRVGKYDPTQVLTIDPTIDFSSYLGGLGADRGKAIVVDANGNMYIAGEAGDPSIKGDIGADQFPRLPAVAPGSVPASAVFVTKLNSSHQIEYSTILSGQGSSFLTDIDIDSAGAAYITGFTEAQNFPLPQNALRACSQNFSPNAEGYLLKLSLDGRSIEAGTCFGGVSQAHAVIVDSTGNAFVTGFTRFDLPFLHPAGHVINTTASGLRSDAFVLSFSANLQVLRFAQYLGGAGIDGGKDITLDRWGNIIIAGSTSSSDFPTANAFQPAYGGGTSDGFLTKIPSNGRGLVYSTFFGGNAFDAATSLDIDNHQNVVVAGYTTSTNFPLAQNAMQRTLRGAADGFVAKFSLNGQATLFSTLIGGGGRDGISRIDVDTLGAIHIAGSTDIPFLTERLDPSLAAQKGFIVKLNPAGTSFEYASPLGDRAEGIKADQNCKSFITGSVMQSNFPTRSPLPGGSSLHGTRDAFAMVVGSSCGCQQKPMEQKCQIIKCNEQTGQWETEAAPIGYPCMDHLCDDVKICDGFGVGDAHCFRIGGPLDWDDDNECTTETCQEWRGPVYQSVADNTSCDSGDGVCCSAACIAGRACPPSGGGGTGPTDPTKPTDPTGPTKPTDPTAPTDPGSDPGKPTGSGTGIFGAGVASGSLAGTPSPQTASPYYACLVRLQDFRAKQLINPCETYQCRPDGTLVSTGRVSGITSCVDRALCVQGICQTTGRCAGSAITTGCTPQPRPPLNPPRVRATPTQQCRNRLQQMKILASTTTPCVEWYCDGNTLLSDNTTRNGRQCTDRARNITNGQCNNGVCQ